jgi:hypothetical protein
MILLIWSSEKAPACARVLEHGLEQPVRIVSNLDQACEELKAASFLAVLLDQGTYEGSPSKADFVFQYLGAATAVVVNFAITGIDRVVRMVRIALNQRNCEMRRARQIACSLLKAELKDDITALLLCCGIAIQDPTLTPQASEHVKKIEEIANQIRKTLLTEDGRQAAAQAP